MPHPLTPPQHALWDLIRRTYPPGMVFHARDLAPASGAQASAQRRILEGLTRTGVLQDGAGVGDVPTWASGVYYYVA